jgi:predicted glycoside hydrolase/deacetylase ChbG (UPF0249 family)
LLWVTCVTGPPLFATISKHPITMAPTAASTVESERKSSSLFAVLTVCIFGSAIALEQVLPARAKCYVVIHSDDAGMYPSVNQATIDAMERGIVSSCSILVPCPAFVEFASYARAHPERDFGVHLDLNCETKTDRWGPVLGKARVPSLVDSQGFLWGDPADTAKHANIDEVEAELRAQIERCHNAGVRISHLDHHMFVLLTRPDFLRLYVRLGLQYHLPIRYSVAMPDRDDLDPNDAEMVKAYREALSALQSRGMPIFTKIDSANYDVDPLKKRQYYFDLFHELGPGVTEILIHCAYGPRGPWHAPNVERREADTRVFMSQDIADALARQGIGVISWRTFQQMCDDQRGPKRF